jgi:glycerol-3-phosphate acyltransferase PlsY
MTTTVFVIILSYLIGSIPFGVIIAKRKGIDLKRVGSGNIGATNVLRNVGKLSALVVLLGDALKGAVPVLVCQYYHLGIYNEVLAGIAAMTGHIFTLFLRFKGGKGVATGLGAVIALSPKAGIISLVLWLLVALASRYSSLAALVTYLFLPFVMFIIKEQQEKILFSVIVAVMIIIRHRDNIKKLLSGSESKIGKRARVYNTSHDKIH